MKNSNRWSFFHISGRSKEIFQEVDVARPMSVLSNPPEIVVVGGIVMDFRFEVPHWPVPAEAVQGKFVQQPGGKGLNQATACARLGISTCIVGAVVMDQYGDRLCHILEKVEGIRMLVHRIDSAETEAYTDVTAVIVADGRPGYIGCRDVSEQLTSEVVAQANTYFETAKIVIITFDTSLAAVIKALELARRAKKKVIVNAAPPSQVPLYLLEAVECIVMSDWEARRWLEMCGVATPEAIRAMPSKAIAEKFLQAGANTVILTRGSAGCVAYYRYHLDSFRAFRVQDVDTSGASDAFCGALAVAGVKNMPIQEGIRFASAAAALACTKKGTYVSMPDEKALADFLKSREEDPVIESLEEVIPG